MAKKTKEERLTLLEERKKKIQGRISKAKEKGNDKVVERASERLKKVQAKLDELK